MSEKLLIRLGQVYIVLAFLLSPLFLKLTSDAGVPWAVLLLPVPVWPIVFHLLRVRCQKCGKHKYRYSSVPWPPSMSESFEIKCVHCGAE